MESIEKLITNFREIGCKNQLKCALAARVFIDMQLDFPDKSFCHIDKCYDASYDVYLRAQHTDQYEVLVLPLLCQHELNLQLLGDFQCNVMDSAKKNLKLMLAICDPSSNILYYNVEQGFVEKLL